MNELKWLGLRADTDYQFLDFKYHAAPAILHSKLQEIIDSSQDFSLITLTYSRCANVLRGLHSPYAPLLFPDTHDCISLLLGSNDRRQELLKENAATYYFSQGWLDYGRNPYEEYLEYDKKYGEEEAKNLIHALYGRYKKALLIITPGMNIDYYRNYVEKIADFFHWETDEIEGDLGLLKTLAGGSRDKHTIYVEPGKGVAF